MLIEFVGDTIRRGMFNMTGEKKIKPRMYLRDEPTRMRYMWKKLMSDLSFGFEKWFIHGLATGEAWLGERSRENDGRVWLNSFWQGGPVQTDGHSGRPSQKRARRHTLPALLSEAVCRPVATEGSVLIPEAGGGTPPAVTV